MMSESTELFEYPPTSSNRMNWLLEELWITYRSFAPFSKTGVELLFELISQRHERGAMLITSNLPFQEWTEVFSSERFNGALLDRLTHHVNILR